MRKIYCDVLSKNFYDDEPCLYEQHRIEEPSKVCVRCNYYKSLWIRRVSKKDPIKLNLSKTILKRNPKPKKEKPLRTVNQARIMGKNTFAEKRIYELWWKYLQQSDDYKKWLETFAQEYDDLLRSKPPIFISARFDPKWTTLYDLMGRVNVHTASFDVWWERKKSRMDNTTPIDHYVNWVEYEVNNCWINMKEKPSDLEELEKQFRAEFVERMKKSHNLYLIVDPDGNLKILKARFLEMVNQKKKEEQDFYRMTREFSRPIAGKIRIDELEKYLNVFILKERQHKSWEEIISLVSPHYNSEDSETIYEEARRIHQRYLQNAKVIIRNVECGRFPGDYRTPDR